jgi:hypothetical protein
MRTTTTKENDNVSHHYENELKLNGFINVNVIMSKSKQMRIVNGEKTHFEIGSSSKLKFFKSNTNTNPAVTTTTKVWQLNDNDDDK